jgi:hypothetical protein
MIGWRGQHNEELRNLYSSPNIIRMIKSKVLVWAGHVARMEESGTHVGYGGIATRKETTRKTEAYLDGC